MMKRSVLLCIAALLTVFCLSALAETGEIRVQAGSFPDMTSTVLNGEEYVFLPSFADWDALSFRMEGHGTAKAGILSEPDENGVRTALLSAEDGMETEIRVMQSSGLRTVYLISEDPEEHGRLWIESEQLTHLNIAQGTLVIAGKDGSEDYSGELEGLRGRGNGSWAQTKKPYQIKLKKKADLMNTGTGKWKTFTLLTAAQEPSLLRNRIWLDLGYELGLGETPETEPVDLYYDGEYRGSYILAEKVQVKKDRIEGTNFDDILEALDPDLSSKEPEIGTGVTEDGRKVTWMTNAPESPDPSSGTWYAELDVEQYITDPGTIQLEGVRFLSIKVPECAPQNLMEHAGELFDRLMRTLRNHGTDPVSGCTLQEQLYTEEYAKLVLLNELGRSYDGLTKVNGYFVMHEGDDRFSAGPVWDMDLIMGVMTGSDPTGWRESYGWLQMFYSVPGFREEMLKIYREEMLPVLQNILLGGEKGKRLKNLDEYAAEIADSWQMNRVLWGLDTTLEYETDVIRNWLEVRCPWLENEMAGWSSTSADKVELWAETGYTLTESMFSSGVVGWSNSDMIDWEIEQLTEADEENYAEWSYTAHVKPAEGFAYEEPFAFVNGTPAECELQEDGTLTVNAVFEDASYRWVDYDGTDIGYIYDEAEFRKNYPELSEKYGDDSEGLMTYFMEEGIYYGLQGNAYFSGNRADIYMGMHDLFGECPEEYYYQFMDYGYEDWMQSMPVKYEPHFIEP